MMAGSRRFVPHVDRPHEWRQSTDGRERLWYGMDRGGIVQCFDWACIRRYLWDRIVGHNDPMPEDVAAYNAAMDPTGPEVIALMPGEVTSLQRPDACGLAASQPARMAALGTVNIVEV